MTLYVIFEHAVEKDVMTKIMDVFPIKAVPIFFTITFYLSFGKLSRNSASIIDWFSYKRIVSVFQYIALPFFVIMIAQMFFSYAFIDKSLPFKILLRGGHGPGSYYLWEYLLLWIFIPFIWHLLNTKIKYKGILYYTALIILLNVMMSYLQPNHRLYSILPIRHLFLAVIAYVFLFKENFNKYILIGVSFASVIFLYVFRTYDLQPFVYSGKWGGQVYPAYFAYLVVFYLLKKLWVVLKTTKVMKVFYWCGANSWHIFLVQMFILGFVKPSDFVFLGNIFVDRLLFVIFMLVLCPLLVYGYNIFKMLIKY